MKAVVTIHRIVKFHLILLHITKFIVTWKTQCTLRTVRASNFIHIQETFYLTVVYDIVDNNFTDSNL